MNAFPLAPFLTSLTSDGIHTTLDDYTRISLALRADGRWTLPGLRDVLLALLVKDEAQERLFTKRFNAFFQIEGENQAEFEELDIQRALADLQALTRESWPAPKPPLPHHFKKIVIPFASTLSNKSKRTGALIIFAALFLILLIWRFWQQTTRPVCRFPPELVFDGMVAPETRVDTLTLTNTGSAPLTLTHMAITGSDSMGFRLATEFLDSSVVPGDSLKIAVACSMREARPLSALLSFNSNAKGRPHLIPLRAFVRPPVPIRPDTMRTRLYSNVPYVKKIRSSPLVKSNAWQSYAAFSAVLLLVIVFYGFYLWRSRRIPEDQPPIWNEDQPRLFSTSTIGGKPAPRLQNDILDHLADTMGYFQSEQASPRLNVPASIEATGQHGGIPSLKFYKRKQIRALLILQDTRAEALA
ncbi:MAG: hypothetical protein ACREOO_09790 [bacterium]